MRWQSTKYWKIGGSWVGDGAECSGNSGTERNGKIKKIKKKIAISLQPCSTTLSEREAARLFFNNVVCHIGLPIQIISDRDTRWRNDFWKEVCQYMGSQRALTTAYHPQADGQTEIINQTLEITLRAYTNFDRNNWAELLPKIAFAYNNTPHTATGYSPSQLLYGFKPMEPISYLMDRHNQDINRPSIDEIMKPESKEFIQEFDGMQLAAKDAL